MFARREREQGEVESAREDIGRLVAAERDMERKRREKMSAATAEEGSAVDALLSGGSIEASHFGRADAEARAYAKAIDVIRQKRVAAVARLYSVQAAELRATAAAKLAESAELVAKTLPLLRKLSEIEGVEFDHSVLLAQRAGTWIAAAMSSGDLAWCNPFEAGPDIGGEKGAGHWAVPRSLALRREAEEMTRRASSIEEQSVRKDGSLVKPTVAELLDSDEFKNVERLSPAAHAVERWASSCEAQIEANGLAGCPRRYKLVWAEGLIDLADSGVEVDTGGIPANAPFFRAVQG